jgi:hypothetical protein
MVSRFARAVLRSDSSGSGLTWIWQYCPCACDAVGGWSRSLNPMHSRTHDQWFLWERVFPSDYKYSRESEQDN